MPLSRVERRPLWAAHSCTAGRSSRPLRRCALLAEPLRCGGYIVASAQQWPASSRATATATIVRRLPRRSSACQRWWRRRALRSARARTAAGWPCAAALERRRSRERPALMPGRLDQQPARVRVAGLGDRAVAAPLAGGVLARRQAEERAERLRPEALSSRRARPSARARSASRRRAGSRAGPTISANGGSAASSTIARSSASRRAFACSTAAVRTRRRRAASGRALEALPAQPALVGERPGAPRRRPARAAAAASRADAAPASDRRERPHAHAPDRAPPPRAAPAPAPPPARPAATAAPAAPRRDDRS